MDCKELLIRKGDCMKVNQYITKTQKEWAVKTVLEKLRILVDDPYRPELLKEIYLGRKEKEYSFRSGKIFEISKKWSEITESLILTYRGLEEEIVNYDGYKYTTHGLDITLSNLYRIGGIKDISRNLVTEQVLFTLPEKYNLDPDELQKLIKLLRGEVVSPLPPIPDPDPSIFMG